MRFPRHVLVACYSAGDYELDSRFWKEDVCGPKQQVAAECSCGPSLLFSSVTGRVASGLRRFAAQRAAKCTFTGPPIDLAGPTAASADRGRARGKDRDQLTTAIGDNTTLRDKIGRWTTNFSGVSLSDIFCCRRPYFCVFQLVFRAGGGLRAACNLQSCVCARQRFGPSSCPLEEIDTYLQHYLAPSEPINRFNRREDMSHEFHPSEWLARRHSHALPRFP